MLLCGAIAWTAYITTQSMPYWPINPSISTDQWFTLQLDFVRCLWAVLPAAILWGASFPLALAAVAGKGQDPARLVGGVYAANTLGAIIGAVGTVGLILLLPEPQSQHIQQILVVIAAISGLLMLAPAVAGGEGSRGQFRVAALVGLLAVTGGAGWLARNVPAVPGLLVAYGRYAVTWIGLSKIIYQGEGINAFVAVSELPSGVRNYHNAGKVQASSEPQDMKLQRMLGHLTTLLPPTNRKLKVVVIGCGAGVTAGAVSIGPNLGEETIAEIEKSLVAGLWSTRISGPTTSTSSGIPEGEGAHRRRARHFLLTSNEKFDAVPSDPLDPWVKGAASLYTKEFFEIVKQHLNPGGVVTLFVQLYESNEEAVKSEVGTFLEAFPNGVVWGNTQNGQGYDLVLTGQVEPTKIDVDEMEARLKSPEYAQVAQSFREVGINSAVELFSTYAGQPSDLKEWLKDAQINHDWNLRLQFLAGMGLNNYKSAPIYSNMISGNTLPGEHFHRVAGHAGGTARWHSPCSGEIIRPCAVIELVSSRRPLS